MTKKADAPAIRFKGFSDAWEQRKFGEVFDCTVPNNTLSRAELSYDEGTVLNVHYGDVLIKYGSVLDVQKDDIPRIPHRCREDFNGALLQDGDVIIADTAEDETTGKACEIGNLQGSAIVSGLHTMVCRPRNRMALGYLGYYLNSNAYHHQLLPLMQGIKVLSLSRSNIQKTSVSYPTAVKEQQLIAYYFSQLDNLITLHQRKFEKLTNVKKSMLEKMFPQNGSSYPEIRFKGFTDPWEQRKFEEIAVRSSVICSDDTLPRVEYEDIVSGTGRLNKDIYAKQSSKSGIAFHQGDVLYGKLRPYLQNWLLPTFEGLAVGDFWVLQPQNADSSFLYRLIQSRQFDEVANQSTGTKMPRADWKLVSKTVFSIPSNISEQAAIGTYFTALDNLITLHQRECISFTGRAGRLILTANKKRTTSSWEQRKAKDLCSISTGKSNTQDRVDDGIYPFYVRSPIVEHSNRYLFDEEAVLTVGDGVGTGKVFHYVNGKYDLHQRVYRMFDFSEEITAKYFYYYFSNHFYDRVMAMTAKTSVDSVRYEMIAEMDIALPKVKEQMAISAYFDRLDNLITLHQRKPFLMKWRTSDANRNQTNRLVL